MKKKLMKWGFFSLYLIDNLSIIQITLKNYANRFIYISS